MGEIRHYNNGKWTIYTTGEDLNQYTGGTPNTIYVGADEGNLGVYTKVDSDGIKRDLESEFTVESVQTTITTTTTFDQTISTTKKAKLLHLTALVSVPPIIPGVIISDYGSVGKASLNSVGSILQNCSIFGGTVLFAEKVALSTGAIAVIIDGPVVDSSQIIGRVTAITDTEITINWLCSGSSISQVILQYEIEY
jgi:hypothetical protein